MLSAADVAALLRQRLPGLPIKKLHKLLYYCQGHHLATFGHRLFDEGVSAWDMGPVIGRLWRAEHDHGLQPGSGTADEAALNTIGYVVSRYGALTGGDLERLTHAESPWQRADEDREPGGRAAIRDEWMVEFFRGDAAEGSEDAAVDQQAIDALLAGALGRRRPDQAIDDPAEFRRRLRRAG